MLKDFNAVKISIASPEDILGWSNGEVTKAETINYRTFRSEPGGLMAEEIFGPTKDFECYCGKYKKIRYKGIVCDRCGVEVTHKRVRRERMGHINLSAPIAHIWFANGIPNRLSLILDIPQKKLQTVIYYARYVVTNVNEEDRASVIEQIPSFKTNEIVEIEEELKEKIGEKQHEFELKKEDVRKEFKDKDKASLQIEKFVNQENKEIAQIKSAYKQRLDNLDKKFEDLAVLVKGISQGGTISEEEHSLMEDYDCFFYEAGMGAEAMKELLDKMDIAQTLTSLEEEVKTTKSQLKKARLIQRIRILKGLYRSGINPSWIIMNVLPVIPPDLRPIIQLPGGRFATYDLNDLYRRVINRNNRLKRLINLGAPEIILRNEKRMLQESVDSLLDNNHKPGAPALNTRQMPFKSLSDMLRGKQGRFRQNLLGKRVDYSGRAVIISGPHLSFDQCGLPKNVALEIFRPFVIHQLISRGFAANPTKAKHIFEAGGSEVWDILEDVIKNRPVILNRAPSLHKYSMLAFYPILVEGNAIQLHPMVVKGFNADFDGDQMAVHLPLSEKAIKEVKERMFAKDNMLHTQDGSPIINVSKDMAKGIYFLTLMKEDKEKLVKVASNYEEAMRMYIIGEVKVYEPIRYFLNREIVITTVGRIIFNHILPADYVFVNETLSKDSVAKISADIHRRYGNDIAIEFLNKVKDLGFEFAMKLGISFAMEDFRFGAHDILDKYLAEYDGAEEQLVENFYDGLITENELKRLKIEKWQDITDIIQNEVWALAKVSEKSRNLYELDNSGAVPVGSWVKQISGVRGSVSNIEGGVVSLPLKGNFERGLDNFEYFVASKAVRKTFADVALKTANSGYLTRRLVDVAQDVITMIHDEVATEGLVINKSDVWHANFETRLRHRVLFADVVVDESVLYPAGTLISHDIAKILATNEKVQSVEVRSPLLCESPFGISQMSFGIDNSTGELVKVGEAIGIIAAQALGEPTTQLTLKSKSDARAAKSDVQQGLSRVEELLEARTPKALSHLAEIEGVVSIIEDKEKYLIRLTAEEKQIETFKLKEGDEFIVKPGSKVKPKDTLIVTSDKNEIRATYAGEVTYNLEDNVVTLTASSVKEIEYKVESFSDLMVSEGQFVKVGDQLTQGSIDPKQLAELKGVLDAQIYIVKGVQGVYATQGLKVDDRHLEVIARQMGRFGRVIDGGDSEIYLPGDFADHVDIKIENKKLRDEGKKEIVYERVIMGITNAALRTESFLSAASFEQQVRVLTEAALVGKVDNLRGLKENVIIGRPVPLGDELLKNNSEEITTVQSSVNLLKENNN